MEMFSGGLGAEFLKFRRRGAVWLLLGLWVLLLLMFIYVLPYFKGVSAHTGVPASLLPSHLAATFITGCSFYGGAFVLILGALWIGSEYGWGTYRTLFTQGTSRVVVLLCQFTVLLLALLALVVVAFAVAALASTVIAGLADKPSVFPPLATMLGAAASAWLILSMWALFGGFLAIVTSGTTLSIGLGLVWGIGIENILRAVTDSMPIVAALDKAFPGFNATAVIQSVAGTRVPSVPAGQAYAALAAYVVAFALVGCLIIKRRDVA